MFWIGLTTDSSCSNTAVRLYTTHGVLGLVEDGFGEVREVGFGGLRGALLQDEMVKS